MSNLIGRSGENTMTSDDLWEKFEDCAGRVLPAGRLRPLFDGLMSIDTVDDIPGLVGLMESDA